MKLRREGGRTSNLENADRFERVRSSEGMFSGLLVNMLAFSKNWCLIRSVKKIVHSQEIVHILEITLTFVAINMV